MKKIVKVLIVLVLFVVIAACGKSAAVVEVESLIESIGEVTLDSEEVIDRAEKLYAILSDKEKESVKNRIDLVNARAVYDKLDAENKARIEAEERAAREQKEAEERAAREQAEREAQKQADLEKYEKYMEASVEAQKMIDAFKESVEHDLVFVSKYAGNVNGAGKMAFADSFLDRMDKAFDGINTNAIKNFDPDLAKLANTIISNNRKIRSLLITMGITNSDKDVPTIKRTATDTINLMLDFVNACIPYAEEIEELEARINSY